MLVQGHRTLRRPERSTQQLQQSRFARTRRADDRHMLARLDRKRQRIEGRAGLRARRRMTCRDAIELNAQAGHYLIKPALLPADSRPL